jgi:hypothetical protein
LKDELRQIMEGLGLEDSSEIQYSEFLAATMDMNYAIREENILRAFQHFDTDGSGLSSSPPPLPPADSSSGSITINELASIMGSEEHAREIVGEIDLNGDGVVSYEEFKAMMQRLNNHSARYRTLMGESEHPDSELAQEAGMTFLRPPPPLLCPAPHPSPHRCQALGWGLG